MASNSTGTVHRDKTKTETSTGYILQNANNLIILWAKKTV